MQCNAKNKNANIVIIIPMFLDNEILIIPYNYSNNEILIHVSCYCPDA